MNILKHNKKPSKTKKQRKLIKGPNDMVKRSLKNGTKILDYIGKPPVYVNKSPLNEIVNYVKVSLGIPFVKNPNMTGA